MPPVPRRKCNNRLARISMKPSIKAESEIGNCGRMPNPPCKYKVVIPHSIVLLVKNNRLDQ
jgi:hypothetical protein